MNLIGILHPPAGVYFEISEAQLQTLQYGFLIMATYLHNKRLPAAQAEWHFMSVRPREIAEIRALVDIGV